MARIEEVLKKIPKKRSLLRIDRKDRFLTDAPGNRARKVPKSPSKSTIPRAKIKRTVSDVRKRRTRRVNKRGR